MNNKQSGSFASNEHVPPISFKNKNATMKLSKQMDLV